jgi:2-aminoadipate transaminase
MTVRTKKYWGNATPPGYKLAIRMNWEPLLAKRTAAMPRGTVREFLKHAGRPGVISFAGGLPAPELFPLEAVSRAAEEVAARRGAQALQYGQTEGISELRDYLAGRLGTSAENVLITTGAQQALDILGRVLLDPGDIAVVENPTYLSLLSAWRPLGVNFRGVPLEDEFSRALEPRPKLLYCMPNFQNPQGTTLSLEVRQKLALVSNALPIIEDDAYGELRYEGEALPSIHELTGGRAIYVGTFSKVLAPGLRIGWIVAPRPLLDVCVRAKQAMDLHTSTFNQYLAWELIRAGTIETQLPILRREYKARRDAMLGALQREMPAGVSWSKPAGGMFILARLPENQSGRELAQASFHENVLIVPGEDFHVAGGQDTFRLNFSNASIPTIDEGIARLGKIVCRSAAGTDRRNR